MKRLLGICALLSLIFLSCLPLVHSQETYTLIIKAVDHTEQPLSGAFVQVVYMFKENEPPTSTFPKQTNASGFVEFTIQSIEASANITIAWLGLEVAFQGVNLSPGTNFFTIICDVSELSVLTLDGNGLPLQGAEVSLDLADDWPPGIPNSSTTNDQGLAVFPQMPYFSYPVSVKWQGKLVHEGTFDFTSSETSYTADCNVYDLTVNVVDKEDRPTSDADVTVTRSDEWETSKKTGNGVANFTQLATENYSIEASYLSSSNTTTVNLIEDTEVFLKLNTSVPHIFEITVQVMWSDDKPVFDANVVIRSNNGQGLKNGVTDSNGNYTTTLIEGEHAIEVSRRTLNDARNVTIDSETTILFVFDASLRTYTLTVKVQDYDGSLVNGALVEANLNGATVSSSETIGGDAVFDLKDDVYEIVVTWDGKQKEKIVVLTENRELLITFHRGIPFDFIFYMLGISAILAMVCLLAFYLRRRYQRRIKFAYIPESAETT